MRKAFIYGVTMAFLCVVGLAGISTAAVNTGPANIVLKTARAKKPAYFPHAEHQSRLKCGVCHHSKNAAGKQMPYFKGMKIQKCVVCHNKKAASMPENLSGFRDVAHARCKGCHRKTGNRTLTHCRTCHSKPAKK